MNDRKEVRIKIVDLEKYSYVQKYVNCEKCCHNKTCSDMNACPIIAYISRDVLRTTYNIDKSVLHINTGTYGHDCRRAFNVVNMAIDACTRKR